MTLDTDNLSKSYDELPYESLPFALSHPAHLAAIARLFGLQSPPLRDCRVLELGCAAGGNLIPLAEAFPDSQFVGVDLSARQIDDGLAQIKALGLENIELKAMSLTEIDDRYGSFDYIIAHGLYSWVPEVVRDAIMALCRNHLTDQGIAYVSYNTYPGWHINGMVREMMQFHASRFDDPKLKLQQSRSLMEFMAGSLPEDQPFGRMLRDQLQMLRKTKDHYLFHEYLESDNQPLYFHEFMLKAMEHGLQYLGDGEFGTMFSGNFMPQVAATLERIAPDQISREQYMDFLRNRTFRQTLLVHQEQTISRTLNPHNILELYVASAAKPVSAKPDIRSSKVEKYQIDGNPVLLTIDQPIYKSAMQVLAEAWPKPLGFVDLCTEARARIQPVGSEPEPQQLAQDQLLLGTEIQRSYTAGLFEISAEPAHFVTTLSERPIASWLARQQATSGVVVTTRRHMSLQLDELSRQLLILLDGSRDRAALITDWLAVAVQLGLSIEQGGKKVTDPATIKKIMQDSQERILLYMASSALLVG